MKSSFANYAQNQGTQITFFYDNGQTESFNLPVEPNTFATQLAQLLSQPWMTLHLTDQTVMILTGKIVKFEIKPPLSTIQGDGVINDVERVTSLQRGAAGRLAMSE